MTNEERHKKIDEIMQNLFGNDDELKHTFLIALNYEYVDDNGKIHGTDTRDRNRFYDLLGGTTEFDGNKYIRTDGGIADWSKVMDVNYKDYEKFLESYDQGIITQVVKGDQTWLEYNGKLIRSWEDLMSVMKQIKTVKPLADETPTGTLKELLENETFKDSASTYETNISTLQTALDNFREAG